MNFPEYQNAAHLSAQYPEWKGMDYLVCGLCSEAGEVAGKWKKIIRDNGAIMTDESESSLLSELGDVLWYVSELATHLGQSLEDIAAKNIQKLADRQARGVIGGSGDTR